MLMEGSLWFAFGLVMTKKKSWHLWVCHLEYVNILQWIYNKAQGLLEVKSWIWNWTHVLCIGRQYLNHWTTREVPWHFTRLIIQRGYQKGQPKWKCSKSMNCDNRDSERGIKTRMELWKNSWLGECWHCCRLRDFKYAVRRIYCC